METTQRKDASNQQNTNPDKKNGLNTPVKKRFTIETQDHDKRTDENKKYIKNATTDNIKEGSHNETYEKIYNDDDEAETDDINSNIKAE